MVCDDHLNALLVKYVRPVRTGEHLVISPTNQLINTNAITSPTLFRPGFTL